MKNRLLIVVTGWLGDSLFASSIAKKLKEEGKYYYVDYLLGFPQTAPILAQDKYIDSIYISANLGPHPDFPATRYGDLEHQQYLYSLSGNTVLANGYDNYTEYDDIIVLPVNDLVEPPTIKYQKACGVEEPSKEFHLSYPVSTDIIQEMRFQRDCSRIRTVIGVCSTWKQADESLRDIDELEDEFNGYAYSVVRLGNNISQFDGAKQVDKYLEMAQMMQLCDWVVGAEGGLLNLASGLGVPTICATDFTYALFGPDGRLYQYSDPFKRITPSAFFDRGAINLDPSITSNYHIADTMADIINS